VTLGSVESRGGDDRAAARAFVRAAERLPDPDEAARARAAAGWAYRELGDEANAKDQFALAKVPAAGPSQVTPQPRIPLPASNTPPLVERPSPAPPPPTTGSFTIQAGAFRDADRARSRAAELAARARELGLGSPAVRSKRSAAGAEMWVVQVGRFADRASAEKVKAKLGAVNLSVERVTAGG
jgi:cell division protein FtsN